jgi:hypothetical protein
MQNVNKTYKEVGYADKYDVLVFDRLPAVENDDADRGGNENAEKFRCAMEQKIVVVACEVNGYQEQDNPQPFAQGKAQVRIV